MARACKCNVYWHLLNWMSWKKKKLTCWINSPEQGIKALACCYTALSAPVSLLCQKLSHYIHFTCIKFLHPAAEELRSSAAFTMMPRGSADAVKCAVKMLGRIPTTFPINRIFFPLRSLHYGELTVNFILTTSNS